MKTVIIQYNAGNIQSVLYALERLGATALVTDDANEIKTADKVIFPGVGEASTAMQYLKERKLDLLIKNLEQPVLGICLGMQLMCTHSTENNTPYFVHGYYAAMGAHTIATTNYVEDYSSALQKDNFYGVQFHPEKSALIGEQLIKNFLSL